MKKKHSCTYTNFTFSFFFLEGSVAHVYFTYVIYYFSEVKFADVAQPNLSIIDILPHDGDVTGIEKNLPYGGQKDSSPK